MVISDMDRRVALITGANRGIGFEAAKQLLARGYAVILSGRDERAVAEAAAQVGAVPLVLDVTRDEDARRAVAFVKERFGRLDALINNAGVLLDEGVSGLEVPIETVQKTFEVNVYGALRLSQAFAPMMVAQRYGRIVNVSSIMGSLTHAGPGYLAYRSSKAALNMVTRVLAAELKGTGVLVNSVHPGWVRTRMGGPAAPLAPEEGAKALVWAATLPEGGPTGGFFEGEGKPLPW